MNLLLTSIGKRVQLIKHLKKNFKVIGADAGELNAGRYFADKFYKIPKANEDTYINMLLKICKEEDIKVLIPLYEGEFEKLSEARKEFKNIGTLLLLSSKEILDICKDKKKTYTFFKNSDIKLPKVYNDEEIEGLIHNNNFDKLKFIIKPRDGMGSSSVFKAENKTELIFFKNYVKNCIVQEFISGDEYTVDVLVDFKGNPIYIVPRKRIEIRSGEVVKSATIKDKQIIDMTLKVIKKLNELRDKDEVSSVGPLTIQFIKTFDQKLFLLEINPRFGGGVPLSFEAGANYGQKIFDMVMEKKSEYCRDFNEKIMIRYEEAVFLN
ncbi:ATP-grasp domain-containing protein [Clostridium sp. BJN0001]|uniref:ATP-grasp domain-containing protein n=1 Tax=Clostridium sp. BJN0001 TaxID=2930219 RepID=UPI001FD11A8C|nr:ATP-grasp domain-containing protein [Clostridium sp. BJN0001]